jgi:hypothetical protein
MNKIALPCVFTVCLFFAGLLMGITVLGHPYIQGKILFEVKQNDCTEYEIQPRWIMDLAGGVLYDYFDLGGSMESYEQGSAPVAANWKTSSITVRGKYELRYWGKRPPYRYYIHPEFTLARPPGCI